jgi:U6 snRNA-associated Sm-like protein LSm4
MNINLREVICTAPDGEHFWRLPEVHIRGNAIKYLRVPDEVIDQVKEEKYQRSGQRGGRGGHRGGHRGGRKGS